MGSITRTRCTWYSKNVLGSTALDSSKKRMRVIWKRPLARPYSTPSMVEGNVNGTSRKFTYEVTFSGEKSENEFIPRLWATRRVGYLLDEIRLRGENSELRDEVTELARKYSIVTPYTAYLIMGLHQLFTIRDYHYPIILRRASQFA